MKKHLRHVAVGFTLVSLIFLSPGCTDQEISAPTMDSAISSKQLEQNNSVFATSNFDSIGANSMDSNEIIALSYHGNQDIHSELNVRSVLRIPQQSACKNIAFRMSLVKEKLNKNIVLDFGPQGIVFEKPALLNIEAIGLDLSGKQEEDIGLYYDNNGKWERMKTGDVIVNIEKGFVKIIDGELPHFSKYGIIAE